MCQVLAHERCGVSFNDISKWFDELRQFLLEVGHPDLLDDPACIYNCDETGFPMQLKPQKVIAHKEDRHTYQAGTSSHKTQITVMLACSATGHYIPPLVVYPGVQPCVELHQKIHRVFPEGLFGNSESGWMENCLFFEYLQNGFEPAITQ